jgi:hypothetical protein
VIATPIGNDMKRLGEQSEPVPVQAPIEKLAVEALDVIFLHFGK